MQSHDKQLRAAARAPRPAGGARDSSCLASPPRLSAPSLAEPTRLSCSPILPPGTAQAAHILHDISHCAPTTTPSRSHRARKQLVLDLRGSVRDIKAQKHQLSLPASSSLAGTGSTSGAMPRRPLHRCDYCFGSQLGNGESGCTLLRLRLRSQCAMATPGRSLRGPARPCLPARGDRGS